MIQLQISKGVLYHLFTKLVSFMLLEHERSLTSSFQRFVFGFPVYDMMGINLITIWKVGSKSASSFTSV